MNHRDPDLLEQAIKNIYGGNYLDIACGRGEFLVEMKEKLRDISKITGIDILDRHFAKLKQSFSELSLIKMNAENTAFADETFNCISISNSLHHFDNPMLVLQEAARILKSQGIIIIREMNCDPGQKLSQQAHIGFHHLSAEIDSQNGVSHRRTFSSKEIFSLLDTTLKNFEIDAYPLDYSSLEPDSNKEETVSNFEKIIKTWTTIGLEEGTLKNACELKDFIAVHGITPPNAHYFICKKR